MATQLRILDDAEGLSKYYKEIGDQSTLGEVIQSNSEQEPLYLRDMTNKIIHAAKFRWDLSAANGPTIICLPTVGDHWKEARINVVSMMRKIGAISY
jgi:hypothetical protein